MNSVENIKEKNNSDSTTDRILSVDVLRGFDMLFLIGGNGVAIAIVKLFGGRFQEIFLPQFGHTSWAGFTFYDLIFPLFIFIMGMSVVFSLSKIITRDGKTAAYKRLFRRSFILYILGILYYGGFGNEIENIRLVGVLQRLALCYFFTGIIFINFSLRGMITWFFILLLGYWFLLSFVPVPGIGEVSFAEGKNWANYIDEHFMPGYLYEDTWDPEGLLSTLPAIASCLLGVFAALLLRKKEIEDRKKVYYFIGSGVIMIILGFLWGLQFPVIKKIWTSSYVLVAGGYSLILFGLFYLVIDVLEFKKWTAPFVWIGMNAITIYMAKNIVDFNRLAHRFVGGDIKALLGERVGYFLMTLVSLTLTMFLVRFMYKKKIFLRV